MNVGFAPEKQKKPVASLRNLVPENRGDAFLPLPKAEPKITITPQPLEFNPNAHIPSNRQPNQARREAYYLFFFLDILD